MVPVRGFEQRNQDFIGYLVGSSVPIGIGRLKVHENPTFEVNGVPRYK